MASIKDKVDFSDPEQAETFFNGMRRAMMAAIAYIDAMSGGGANTLGVCNALGVYAELQTARSLAADPEGSADYVAAMAKFRTELEAIFASKPPITPEEVAKAKELGCLDYNEAREALTREALERQSDRNLN